MALIAPPLQDLLALEPAQQSSVEEDDQNYTIHWDPVAGNGFSHDTSGWTLTNSSMIQPIEYFDGMDVDLVPVNRPMYSISSLLDERSLRCIQLFMHECERFSIIRPNTITLNYQIFHQEPAFRHLMNAFVTLASADYEQPNSDSKEFVYSSLIAAIKRMRFESHDIDDEALVKSRALLALIETSRTHGGNDFEQIFDAVTCLFDTWEAEMGFVSPAVAARRRKLISAYGGVLKASQPHFKAVKAIQHDPQPRRPSRPDFQRNFFDFLCGVEITSYISESYGYSISEPTNKSALEKRLKAWYRSFEAATSKPQDMIYDDVLQARLLLAHYLRASVVLDACVPNSETRYARHNSDFVGILDCIEKVLETSFWMEELMWLGVVSPIFFTAVHCRTRAYRHRALAMLQAHNIEERTWNSRVAFLVASAVAAVESNHPASTESEDVAFVRLLRADFKSSTETLSIDYIDVRTKEKKSHEMLVLGAEDVAVCRALTVWPLVVEVRTHGAAFSRTPLGGPLDVLGEYDENDYLKWLKAALRPRPMAISAPSK